MTTTSTTTFRALRTRWAAVGAAVAVTLGAGVGTGAFTTEAATSADESVVVAVDPVRIVDTRSGVGIDDQLESGVFRGVRVTGSIPTTDGTAIVVPDFATGVLLNVTVVRPSSSGFLSVVPGTLDAGPYATSSLNFEAGVTTPNAVAVALPGAGATPSILTGAMNLRFDGASGATTHVLVDVVGYMTQDVLIDYRQRISTLEATSPVTAAFSSTPASQPVSAFTIVETLTIDTPKDGTVVVNSSAIVSRTGAGGGQTGCSITTGTSADDSGSQIIVLDLGQPATLSGTRGIAVSDTSQVTINLICFSFDSGVTVRDTNLTATFVPVDPETFAGG